MALYLLCYLSIQVRFTFQQNSQMALLTSKLKLLICMLACNPLNYNQLYILLVSVISTVWIFCVFSILRDISKISRTVSILLQPSNLNECITVQRYCNNSRMECYSMCNYILFLQHRGTWKGATLSGFIAAKLRSFIGEFRGLAE